MKIDRASLYDLFAEYGALIDASRFDEWLSLFAGECRYRIIPRENFDRGLPAALIFCDSRAVLEDRIRALREANKYNIHTDRHVIGLPRLSDDGLAEAPFAAGSGIAGLVLRAMNSRNRGISWRKIARHRLSISTRRSPRSPLHARISVPRQFGRRTGRN